MNARAFKLMGVGAAVLGSVLLTACAHNHAADNADLATVLPAHDTPGYTAIQHGRYLIKAGDCAYCHTAPGGKPFAGGRAVLTPFGTIYSTNITPDKDTGIGSWSETDFYRALHSGVDRQGHNLYPAFPYPWYTKVTPADVRDMKAYLDTVKPVREINRQNRLPWPMTHRGVMTVWNKLYFDEGAYAANANKSAQWNRGAYLVEGLGHCGSCHTGKNLAGAPSGEPFAGGLTVQNGEPRALGRWSHGFHAVGSFAPSLDGDSRDGLGDWTAAEIVEYLKTGSNDKSSAAGDMAEVVTHSTQYLSQSDLTAIAVYLKDLPHPKAAATKHDVDKNTMAFGSAVYTDDCAGCHMERGQGLAHVFPPLKGSSAIQAARPDTMIRVVLGGAQIPATQSKPTGLQMPAFNEKLTDAQIAAVVTYIRNAWGNSASVASKSDVAKLRRQVKQ